MEKKEKKHFKSYKGENSETKDEKVVLSSNVKAHVEKLHPLESKPVPSPFADLPVSDYLQAISSLVRFEIILTLILIVITGFVGYTLLKNPAAFMSSTSQQSTTEDGTGSETTPTEAATQSADGKVFKDARDLTTSSDSKNGQTAVETKEYTNSELGFTVSYPVNWSLEEPVVNGVKNTIIRKPDNKVNTYISFQNTLPDSTEYEGQGTENKRDIYTFDTIFKAEGYVKFGNALWASFPVKPGSFYVVYAGSVENDILPILATFRYF